MEAYVAFFGRQHVLPCGCEIHSFFQGMGFSNRQKGSRDIYVSKGAWLLAACVDLLPGQHVLLCEAVKLVPVKEESPIKNRVVLI